MKKSVVDLNLKTTKNKYVLGMAPEDPKLPAFFVFCGSRGSSKTYACVAMVKLFEKMVYIPSSEVFCFVKMCWKNNTSE